MRISQVELAERLRRRQFERMVRRAVDSLPSSIHSMMENVAIVIEDEPTEAQQVGEDDGPFGLYEGIPLTERTSSYGLILPDKITIFRGPLERATTNPSELYAEVQATVIHEVAHHFGMDEARIAELGYE
jgi:predicted Zn-dependent protease with MMP-like domain